MATVRELETDPTGIDGLTIVRPKEITDERGVIREVFRVSAFADTGIRSDEPWAQVNLTTTNRGAIRGMHGEPMVKLVGVVGGEAYGAYLDARPESPTFGRVETVHLTIGVHVVVPAGVCNGFQALEDATTYLYCFTREWRPDLGGPAVHPLDPELGIAWPLPVDPADPSMLSAKDASLPPLRDLLAQA